MAESDPEVLAVSFQKGGTGKTFTALNVAGGLAARGFDVLAIDLDPQGTLTANLGKRDIYKDLDALSLDEVGELWDDIEYEWKKANDTELSKNWDFYMACFRVLLNNPDLVREELGMDTE